MSGVSSDWRNGSAYNYFDQIGPEKIAHEFLRRNEQYAADYATLTATGANEDQAPAMAHWGLRFRGRPAVPRRSGDDRVAPTGRSGVGNPGAATATALHKCRPRRGRRCPDRLGR